MSYNTAIKNSAELIEKIESHLREADLLFLTPVVAVVGATASGKTGLGIAIARHFNGEIISADSRQIYTLMDIGTAKPTTAERASAPHHLIDFIDPAQPFSLSDYQRRATETIKGMFSSQTKSHLPILVGGTGLYINAVTQNYALPESKPDLDLREKLEKIAHDEGKEAVHSILQKLDPEAAANIHANNLRYVVRAIEIATHTNKPKADVTNPSEFHTLYLTIDWPREELYDRINRRIDQQISEGLIDETKQLLSLYSADLPSMSSLGYKEIGEYLAGHITLEFAVEQFKQHTRNYAKRQLTWFRKIKPLYSIAGAQLSQIISDL